MNNFSALRLTKVAEADFPTQFGSFRIYGFEGCEGDLTEEAVVLKMGNLAGGPPPLVRIHSQWPHRRRVSQLALRLPRAA